MIDSLSISGVATYPSTPEVLDGFSLLNFFYGSNGAGKTTISKLIAEESSFPSCKINWKSGTLLKTVVYNRDFIEAHFNQSSELKGIFTLGQKNVETMKAIEDAKKECDRLDGELAGFKSALGDEETVGKKAELRALDDEFKTKCWTAYSKHKAKLGTAFDGFRNSKENFRDKILKENTENKSALQTQDNLEKRAQTVFGPAPAIEPEVATIDGKKLVSYETDSILKKRVIGKDDVDVAAMIKKLGNSDWVRMGRSFYDVNDLTCPFCQQKTTESLSKSLNEYFDESFIKDSTAIETLETNYSTEAARLQQQLNAIIASPATKFLDLNAFKIEKELFESRVTINLQKIAIKRKEPSQIVELESMTNVLASIGTLLDAAKKIVDEHNKTVKNLAQEKKDLTSEVWKFVVDGELKADLTTHLGKRTGLLKAIANLEAKIITTTDSKTKKAAEIRALEKDTTSIQPTVNAINTLLLSFGFHGFSLAVSTKGNSYVILRPNGKDAKQTLSEGEKTFITFLYFFHLLKGSVNETGITENRIVVFDDPVSSLDSDILFIVGSLIKSLFAGVKAGTGDIKQVFVLTHNVYFHKEVTFHQNHKLFGPNDVTYWTVRKSGLNSKVLKCVGNPVKTGYELLWLEVRKSDRSNLAIQNTLRRILENYFKILGNCDPDDICEYFTGQEKLVCKSLFSWVNDGSHSALDDLYATTDPSLVENYLHVFRSIFEKTKHIEHYKMMMAEDYVENPTPPVTTSAPRNN